MQKTLAKLKSGDRVTIVALGDSNTELTFHTAGRLNWTGLLQEALFETYGRNRARVINAGCAGDGAESAARRLAQDVLPFEPDLLIVSLGMMNACQSNEAQLASFEAAIRQIIAQVRQTCGSEVLLRTPNPVVASNQPGLPAHHRPGHEWPEYSMAPVAARLAALSCELECDLVDHYALWTASQQPVLAENPNHLWSRMSDATHPNALGHLCFFRELAPLFEVPLHFPWEA